MHQAIWLTAQTQLFFLALTFFSSPVSADVVLDWATVGNPGNTSDSTGYAPVSYTYRISKHEVTNDQYAEFLNSVAQEDPNFLYSDHMDITRVGTSGSYAYSVDSGSGSKPVDWVSFNDAMRFVNWLQNGQGSGGTESGVYTIGNGFSETRSPVATYFLPNDDEWYKAAYHKNDGVTGNYFDYPTSGDTIPTASMPTDIPNRVNMEGIVNDTTDVGAYTGTKSPYGAFDMAGNLWEWNEATLLNTRGKHGGYWGNNTINSSADAFSMWAGTGPSEKSFTTGFRVASTIPEPSSMQLGLLAVLGLLLRRRRAS